MLIYANYPENDASIANHECDNKKITMEKLHAKVVKYAEN